jgi:hypothetical protein
MGKLYKCLLALEHVFTGDRLPVPSANQPPISKEMTMLHLRTTDNQLFCVGYHNGMRPAESSHGRKIFPKMRDPPLASLFSGKREAKREAENSCSVGKKTRPSEKVW